MKIAIDAMGGDNAPQEIVFGTLKIAEEKPEVTFRLFGDEAQINNYIEGEKPVNIEIIHTDEKIEGDDEPAKSIRRKKKASMVLAARDVKDGNADALFSAGNTGALVAAGLLIVGRIKGIDRPALMATIPQIINEGKDFNMLDMGANSDAKPINLHQHAVLGSYYAKYIRGIDNPKVGLINNGTEANKGNMLTQESYELIANDERINFIGNVEASDVFNGKADVLVADGFTGNAVLKTVEGTAKALIKLLKETISEGGFNTKLGGLMLKDALKEMSGSLNAEELGGAILIGVKAPVFKSHGSSKASAVYHTLGQTVDMVSKGIVDEVANAFKND